VKAQKRRQRAGILVQVLIVIAALLALMATLVANQRVTLHRLQTQLRQRRAEAAVRSGLAQAKAVLASANTNLVTKRDEWATLGSASGADTEPGSEAFTLDDNTSFRVQIIDTSSQVNINTATEAQMQLLPVLPAQISAVLDWREGSLAPRGDGAKDEYYNNLTTPYNTKLGNFYAISEILLVRDWTASDLYGVSTQTVSTGVAMTNLDGDTLPLASFLTAQSGMPNTDVTGAARTNWNQANINPALLVGLGIPANVATQAPFQSFAQVLRLPGLAPNTIRQVLETATFSPAPRLTGKINLNTATAPVLQTVPGVTADIAQGIIAQQNTGFTTLGDLTQVPSVSGPTLATIADAFGVGSDTWLVRIWGESGPENDRVHVAVEATVGIRNSVPVVLSWERLSAQTIPAWWDWEETATTTTELVGASLP
jgi:DNA uptake protein ComE-like DNA-binding protein